MSLCGTASERALKQQQQQVHCSTNSHGSSCICLYMVVHAFTL